MCCGSWCFYVVEEIVIWVYDYYVLIVREVVFISMQVMDECVEVWIFIECISKQFGCFGIVFIMYDVVLMFSFCQCFGYFIVGSCVQFFCFFLIL